MVDKIVDKQLIKNAASFLISLKGSVTPRIVLLLLQSHGITDYEDNDCLDCLEEMVEEKRATVCKIVHICEKNERVAKHFGEYIDGFEPEVISTLNTRLGESFFRKTKQMINFDTITRDVIGYGVSNLKNTDIVVYAKDGKTKAFAFGDVDSANKNDLIKYYAQENNLKVSDCKSVRVLKFKKELA